MVGLRWVGAMVLLAVGCGGSTGESSGTGAGGGAGGIASTTGATGAGGAAVGPTSAVSTTASTVGSGGTSTSVSASVSASSSSASTTGGGGNVSPAVPSAGCGKGGLPNGGLITTADHIISFPPSYDGKTAMPMVIGFHAASNPVTQIRDLTKGSELDKNFVMVFPKSIGTAWVKGTDDAKVNALYDDVMSTYCIDTSRVFAVGHSSGAQYIVQLMCAGDKRFKAIGPVASSAYCKSWKASAVPAIVVHNINDMERAKIGDGDGVKDLAPYLASNACGNTTTPYDVGSCSGGSAAVKPGCVEYDSCGERLVWCHHDDPQYSGTGHGWPCFATHAFYQFFTSLH